MKSTKVKTPVKVLNPQKSSYDAVQQAIEESCDRYNNIRKGILFVLQDNNLQPIEIYDIANQLDLISMIEYQNSLIDFVEKQTDGTEYNVKIAFGRYKLLFEERSAKRKAWSKIIEILEQENIKAMELSRISAELRTTAMENFIHALGMYIDGKVNMPTNELNPAS